MCYITENRDELMEYQLNIQNQNNNTPPQCPAAVQCTQSHLALTLCVHLKLKHNLSGERSVEPEREQNYFIHVQLFMFQRPVVS